MTKKINLLLPLTFISTIFFGQADLIVHTTGFQPNQIDKGDILLVEAMVTNIGNTTAAANFMFLFYSQDLTISNDEIITRVSIKELAPNESQEIRIIYPTPSPLSSGNYYLAYEVDPFDDVLETDEDNLFCASNGTNCVTFNITNNTIRYQKFNFPILFVHGWTGSSQTWDEFTDEADLYYGWSYGGRLNYCLNPDNDQSTSDGFIKSFTNASNLNVGDYYYVNFDVSNDGVLYVGNDNIPFNDHHSNQSAVVKQGWAVKDAVKKVLEVTGAEKVILVGHSMGGLAIREYLQNSYNWQSDGKHHVAKLFTIGTPNGGSNASIGNLAGLFAGYDEWSEAVRDLRYSDILYGGQFLDGGKESIFSGYYNNDVDCNGVVGNDIIGLNQKYSPNDVNYSSIVGIGNNLPLGYGDGIVEEARADLNNYLIAQPPMSNLHADRFNVNTSHIDIHKENHSVLIQGLDEPSSYSLAYPIRVNSVNYCFSTKQAINNSVPPNNAVDWDDFTFDISERGLLDVDIWNIPIHDFAVHLLDENYTMLKQVIALGESNIGFEYQLNPGTYYLEFSSFPTTNSWRFPFASTVFFTPESSLIANFSSNVKEGCKPIIVNFSNQSDGDPTDFSWTFEGGTPNKSNLANPTIIYNEVGIYPVSLTISNAAGTNSVTRNSYITVKSRPEADFNFSVQQNKTVSFSNQSQFGIDSPNYLWDFGDGQTTSQASPTHTYQNDGTYSVKLVASNSCGSSTSIKSIDIITVSTADLIENTKVLVYPNPSKEKFNLKIEGTTSGNHTISLINNLGQRIQNKDVYKMGDSIEFQMDVSGIPSGTYFIQISSGKEYLIKKIVLE